MPPQGSDFEVQLCRAVKRMPASQCLHQLSSPKSPPPPPTISTRRTTTLPQVPTMSTQSSDDGKVSYGLQHDGLGARLSGVLPICQSLATSSGGQNCHKPRECIPITVAPARRILVRSRQRSSKLVSGCCSPGIVVFRSRKHSMASGTGLFRV